MNSKIYGGEGNQEAIEGEVAWGYGTGFSIVSNFIKDAS
jgi:hypothetical protein